MRPSTSVRTLTSQMPAVPDGTRVMLHGHVHRNRELASVTFLILRDRTGLTQVVIKPADEQNAPPEETPVEVTGVATANPEAPSGVEVTSPTITCLSEPAATPPVELWRPQLKTTLPTMLDYAPVMWRHPVQRAAWEIAAASIHGFRKTLYTAGFTEVRSPKFVASATESGANVFAVDYFGRQAYLAQSPQFYKQQLVGVFERVYEVGPVFRAEPHNTARHLAEYTSLDVEFGFIRDHRDVLVMLRDVVAGMVTRIAEHAADAVDRLGIALPLVPEEIPVIHFADALARVGAPADEPDLAPEHERALGQWARDELGTDFLAVEGYPMSKRPFYTHPWTADVPSGGPWSNSFDVLFRGVELVTGGQRLHRYDDYIEAINGRGEQPDEYAAYLQAFAHGMPPHGGFAIGLERWAARIVGAQNIREVTLFPRDLHRLTP